MAEKVLVSGDDFYAVLAGVRALRVGGYRPWLALAGGGTYAARSRTVEGRVRVADPQRAPDAFARDLAEAARTIAVAVVLPGSEDALTALTGREELFAGRLLGVPAREVVERATDKAELERRAAEAGLRAPQTLVVSRDDLAAAEALRYPLVVKPMRSALEQADGSIARGWVRRVGTRDELARAAAAVSGEQLVVQPFLDGPLVAVAGVAWQGEVVCTSHQVARRIYPTLVGVSSYAETLPREAPLDAAVARLVEGLGWSGIFQLQLIRANDGDYAIDFNPRMYGSMALAIAAGLNLPSIWVDLLLGREPRIGAYRPGTRYRVEDKDARALAHELFRGNVAGAARGALPRRRTTHAVFQVRDPLPILTTVTKAFRKATGGGARAGSRI